MRAQDSLNSLARCGGRQMVQRIYLRGLAVERLEQGFTHDGFECHKPLKLWYQVPKLSILLTLDPAL